MVLVCDMIVIFLWVFDFMTLHDTVQYTVLSDVVLRTLIVACQFVFSV